MAPVIVYDDRCYLCAKFARLAGRASGGRIAMVGHYTSKGEEIRKILGESAPEMFWVIERRRAYGGRAALYPLLKAVLGRGKKRESEAEGSCAQGCRGAGAVFARSASLLTHSKKIDLC